MPRKGHVAKRDVLQDPIYNSKLVTRLINKIMLDGKKELHRIFFTTHLISSRKRRARMRWKYSKRHWTMLCRCWN